MIKWIVTASISDLDSNMLMIYYYFIDAELISIQYIEYIFRYRNHSISNTLSKSFLKN